MIPGETRNTCLECNATLKLQVCRSRAGFYLGTMCACGPYSRESGYYVTEEHAVAAFRKGGWERK
jgi:hypothetical protein